MVWLSIELDDIDDAEMVLPIILDQIRNGYTSGYEPTWSFEED